MLLGKCGCYSTTVNMICGTLSNTKDPYKLKVSRLQGSSLCLPVFCGNYDYEIYERY